MNDTPVNTVPAVGEGELAACVEDLELRGLLLDNVPDGIAAFSIEGELLYANSTAERMWGVSMREMRESGPWAWLAPGGSSAENPAIERLLCDGHCKFDTTEETADGELAHYEILARVTRGSNGHIIVAAIRDVSERVRAETAVRHLAYHDQLTGLGNRVLLHRELTTAISAVQRHGDGLGVIFIDLDDFKPINDRYGHHTGDTVLIEVGRRILGAVRGYDTVARLGGDEFVIVAPRLAHQSDLERISEQVSAALATPIHLPACDVRVKPSIGLALFEPGDDAGTLLTRADLQMYGGRRLTSRYDEVQKD